MKRYMIRVSGQLDSRWRTWFEDMEMAYTEAGDTVLSGPVADQAALQGMLARIGALNLTLISVSQAEYEPAANKAA
jgi:hypothetical protein